MSSNVLRAGAADCKPWEAPQVGDRRKSDSPQSPNPADLQKEIYDKAFARGHAEGIAAGQKSMEDISQRMQAILTALQKPLAAADESVVDNIAALAISLAKRLVRRELRTDRAEVVGVVREALAVLPVGLREVRLHLHPQDAKLVSEMLVPVKGDAAWSIIEDPVVTRGGCRISSPTSQVDATIETRLARVINSMLGGERDEDRSMQDDE